MKTKVKLPSVAWMRARRAEAVQANLAFWAAQPPRAWHNEAGNVHSAIHYGLRQARSRTAAARLLAQAFALALGQPAHWLPLLRRALADKQLPSSLRAELLYQCAALHWQLGQDTQAQRHFTQGARLAQQHGFSTVQARCLIGLCLAPHHSPARRQAHATQLLNLLKNAKLPATLAAPAYAALGSCAYLDKRYAAAAGYMHQALHAQPAAGRGYLHALAGLCAHAQADLDTALQHYNAAAQHLGRGQTPLALARIELLRATAHYHKSARGQQVRLQPAIAALLRAASLLHTHDANPQTRAELEALLGRAYTRSGDVANGLRYLRSALALSQDGGQHALAADLLGALHALETKNPA